MVIKITNCTTTTGGGKVPLRLRHNQNVTIRIAEDDPDYWSRPNSGFVENGRYYYTTIQSKSIVVKK